MKAKRQQAVMTGDELAVVIAQAGLPARVGARFALIISALAFIVAAGALAMAWRR